MCDVEILESSVSEIFFSLKEDILNWNYEKLSGIGHRRGHDKYAIIELNIYTLEEYPDKDKLERKFVKDISNVDCLNNFSFLVWKLSESQFPMEVYNSGKSELIKCIESALYEISLVKEQKLQLVFEIVWAGYGVTDAWGRGAVSYAFINALYSCFDYKLYQNEMNFKLKHPLIDGFQQCRFS